MNAAARWRAPLAALAVLAGGCDEPLDDSKVNGPPPNCLQADCHVQSALTKVVATAAPREYVRTSGHGLTRAESLMPSSTAEFTLVYPERGHHPAQAVHACKECHPVSSEGARHGISQYPDSVRSLVFAAGKSCASATCHAWLPTSATSSGFKPASGTAPSYTGSVRPEDLLSAGKDGHAAVYARGYVKKASGDGIKVARILPGCGGCHATRNDKHGHTPGCLDCHTLGGTKGQRHKDHIKYISDNQSKLDSENPSASSCDYCHGLYGGPTALRNGACYNCHLGGHQVLDASGKAHFWKL